MRSAISRAYYAVFCTARDYLLARDTNFTGKKDDHHVVCNWFLAQGDKVSKDIGEHLDLLRKYRNRADYNDVFHEIENTAKQALQRANQALHLLSKLK